MPPDCLSIAQSSWPYLVSFCHLKSLIVSQFVHWIPSRSCRPSSWDWGRLGPACSAAQLYETRDLDKMHPALEDMNHEGVEIFDVVGILHGEVHEDVVWVSKLVQLCLVFQLVR